MITTAAVATPAGEFQLVEVTLDELRADEVLVDVVAVGMCHTDLSAASGAIPFPLPGILGHEGAGRVRSVVTYGLPTLNIISCPSCSRVENQAFIDLAEQVNMTHAAQRMAQRCAALFRPAGAHARSGSQQKLGYVSPWSA